VRGLAVRAELGPERYAERALETLVARPRESLARVAAFFALPGGAWLDRAAALVRGAPPLRFGGLPADERERLAEACRPGRALLDRAMPETARE
jgi:hypothetical protein